jgi:hypothetical protein
MPKVRHRYLGKTVEIRKKRMYSSEFYFEIKYCGGLIVILEWIDHFDSEMLVLPAKYNDPNDPYVHNDTWLDYSDSRFVIINEIIIITGRYRC